MWAEGAANGAMRSAANGNRKPWMRVPNSTSLPDRKFARTRKETALQSLNIAFFVLQLINGL